MAEECHTSVVHNDALVKLPIHTHKPTTCEDALMRPLQGCNNPPTYKEALVRPPPVNMSQQLETDNYLCERYGHIMARVFAMAANNSIQGTTINNLKIQGGPGHLSL